MIAGILLHPVRIMVANSRRNKLQRILSNKVRYNTKCKMWERMHDMSDVTGTAYTSSELYPLLMK